MKRENKIQLKKSRMLNEQILQNIECALAHDCATSSNKCAECDLGYKFIACEPIPLQCGHYICKKCESKTKEGSINCKFCKKRAACTGGLGGAAEALFQFVQKELFGELRDKYEKALHLLGASSF